MPSRVASLSLLILLLLSACRDPKVASYRVPKETPEPLPPILTGGVPASSTPAAAGSGNMASTAVPTATGEGLAWTAPGSWRLKPASAMRKGSYAVPGSEGTEADLSITAFPGDVGGTLANINRWRGQLELPPLAESDLETALTHLDIGNLHADVAEFASTSSAKPQRMIGAIVPFNGATWFFKLTGPDALVAQEKPAFLSFLKTVKASSPAQ